MIGGEYVANLQTWTDDLELLDPTIGDRSPVQTIEVSQLRTRTPTGTARISHEAPSHHLIHAQCANSAVEGEGVSVVAPRSNTSSAEQVHGGRFSASGSL